MSGSKGKVGYVKELISEKDKHRFQLTKLPHKCSALTLHLVTEQNLGTPSQQQINFPPSPLLW